MRCIAINDEIQLKNTIVTVGKFDGLHKGHEKLMEVMKENANGRQKVVLTFAASPKAFLDAGANQTIVTEQEKQMLCQQQGIDVYMKMPLTKTFLSLSPEDFVEKILKEKMGATTIVCGPDFRFGAKAMGDVDFLRAHQDTYGYKLIVIEKEQYRHRDISSTAIRGYIAEGNMAAVNEMLDHPYRVIGMVEHGKQLGRTIGFPTANILPDATKLLPPNGVYRTVAIVGGKRYYAISNVGTNPTVEDGSQKKVETHIFDFADDIYGEIVEVQFYEFIRPEQKFENVDALKAQIQADKETCRKISRQG